MSLVHRAICQDHENGYEPSALITTTYGLRLILAALQEHCPEPCEGALHKALVDTLERNTRRAAPPVAGFVTLGELHG